MNKDWSSTAVLQDYLQGKLSPQDMFQVERHALEDPFMAEALEGLSQSPEYAVNSLSLLQKQLHERIAQEKQHKKQRVITWQRLSIGATAAVLFIAVSTIFWMKNNASRKEASKASVATVTTYDVNSAQPIGGYSAYQEYLQKNNRLKVDAVGEEVTLEFNVLPDGKPGHVEVLKSPGQGYSDEAIRLLQEGPRWELPVRTGEKVQLSISF